MHRHLTPPPVARITSEYQPPEPLRFVPIRCIDGGIERRCLRVLVVFSESCYDTLSWSFHNVAMVIAILVRRSSYRLSPCLQ